MRNTIGYAAMLGFGLALVSGCDGSSTGVDEGNLTATLKEGSPQALAVLALVNDRAVTKKELDVDAALDARAATAIIAHRDGADGALRTADDDLFDDVAELDAQKFVAATALKQLLAYADKKGYLAHELAKETDVIFSPQLAADSHNARVAELIGDAETSIDIAMYSFSDSGILKALESAVKRGVVVRFIYDGTTEDWKQTGAALAATKSAQLENVGVDVRYVNKIMHHKFMIIDGPRDDGERAKTARIATGSGNWSNGAATVYDENTLFMTGQTEIALRLQREYNLLWEHSREFAFNPNLVFQKSTFAIPDEVIPDGPGSHDLFTSANFTVSGDTFSTNGANEIADAWVSAIGGAKKSIHIASGHLRSRPVSEALMKKAKDAPDVEIRVYLDDQEYLSQASHDIQVEDLEACLTAAGASEAKKRACTDKGFLYGLAVDQAGVDVQYKFYAYRWDASYAKQMHHKYMIIDGTEILTGSYNLSDNAEHQTFENMLILKGPEFAELASQYEENFASMWVTGRADKKLDALMQTVKTAKTIPIVFDSMALTWEEVTALKSAIRTNCPLVDSTEFRTNAPAHKTCTRP